MLDAKINKALKTPKTAFEHIVDPSHEEFNPESTVSSVNINLINQTKNQFGKPQRK